MLLSLTLEELIICSDRVAQPRPQGFSLKKWVGREKALASAGHVHSLSIPEKLIYMQPAATHPFFKGKALGMRLRVARISDDYFESLLLRQSIYFTSTIPTCNLVWGTCSPTLLYEVEYMHARAAKIIYRLSDVSNEEAFTKAGWESINSMYKWKLLTFVYQVYKSELLYR